MTLQSAALHYQVSLLSEHYTLTNAGKNWKCASLYSFAPCMAASYRFAVCQFDITHWTLHNPHYLVHIAGCIAVRTGWEERQGRTSPKNILHCTALHCKLNAHTFNSGTKWSWIWRIGGVGRSNMKTRIQQLRWTEYNIEAHWGIYFIHWDNLWWSGIGDCQNDMYHLNNFKGDYLLFHKDQYEI